VRKNPRNYTRQLSLKEICRRAGIPMKQYAYLRRELKRQLKGKEAKIKIED